jgi:transposase
MKKEQEEQKAAAVTRRTFSREFILEAIRLSSEPGHSIRETAQSLGIHENLLYKWRRMYENDPANAFPGQGHMKPKDEELFKLKKELERVTRERDILKKAVAIFSKMPQ